MKYLFSFKRHEKLFKKKDKCLKRQIRNCITRWIVIRCLQLCHWLNQKQAAHKLNWPLHGLISKVTKFTHSFDERTLLLHNFFVTYKRKKKNSTEHCMRWRERDSEWHRNWPTLIGWPHRFTSIRVFFLNSSI